MRCIYTEVIKKVVFIKLELKLTKILNKLLELKNKRWEE